MKFSSDRKRSSRQDARFERIVGMRFGDRARKVELVVGRPDFANVSWTNKVNSMRYSPLTFLPQNLWEQFHSFANLYFLMASILQIIPETSDSNSVPTVLFALIPVLIGTMLKDGYQDYMRFKQDKRENMRKAKRVIRLPQHKNQTDARPMSSARVTVSMEEFITEEVFWEELRVGDVIQLGYGDWVPADAILLSTSSESGRTYVETKNLDGETNLKPKVTHPKVQAAFSTYTNRVQAWLEARITYEGPSTQLYAFSGEIQVGTEVHALEANQLLLRGSSCQGDTCLSVVVYTGHHTRVYQNSCKSTLKKSRLSDWYDKHVIALVVLQTTFVLILSSMYCIVVSSSTEWYLSFEVLETSVYIKLFFVIFGRVMLMFTYYIPITLLLTLEIVRIFLAQFLMRDEMMKESLDSSLVTVNDVGVIEDLGCVSHIFTDKTGTLTQNLMTFAAIALPGPTQVSSLVIDRSSREERSTREEVIEDCPTFCDPRFPKNRLFASVRKSEESEMELAQCIFIMAVCHTVSIRTMETDGEKTQVLDASSPDELALVCGAHVLGIQFRSRPTTNTLSVSLSDVGSYFYNLVTESKCDSNECTVDILATLDFDNVRKRMSVLVRAQSGRIYLLCKGADSSMLPLAYNAPKVEHASASAGDEEDEYRFSVPDTKDTKEDEEDDVPDTKDPKLEWLESHLEEFSVRGLRTLVLAMREISEDEYVSWATKWNLARTHVGRAADKQMRIQKCIDAVERELTMVGVTGVEDRLQDEVPEVLAALQQAGTKLWVLTGDKQETAINIARSCNLITDTTFIATFNDTTRTSVLKRLLEISRYVQAGQLLHDGGFVLDWVAEEKIERKEKNRKELEAKKAITSRRQLRTPNMLRFDVASVDERIVANRQTAISHGGLFSPIGTPASQVWQRPQPFDAYELPATAGSWVASPKRTPVKRLTLQPSPTLKDTLLLEDHAEVLVFDRIAMVVTGDCMHIILGDTELRRQFFHLALGFCESMICCRVSPIQKSLVVTWSQMYLESQSKAMLAIGDGANDVGMILAARCGVGIQGKEGSQASRSADFSIPQFRYLKRLLFVHGREAYRRNAFLIYVICYRNVAFCMTGFFMNLFTAFSGNDHYDPYLKQLFNSLYTLLPVILYALFDQEYPTEILEKSTALYRQEYAGSLPIVGHSTFTWWFVVAVFTACVCTYIPLIGFNHEQLGSTFTWVGHAIYIAILIPTNFILVPGATRIYWFSMPVMLFGILIYLMTAFLTSNGLVSSNDLNNLNFFKLLLETASFWLVTLLAGTVCLFPQILYNMTIHNCQTPARIVQNAFSAHKKNLKRRIRLDKELAASAKTDKYFWTRTFDPDIAISTLNKSDNVCAAVVPRTSNRSRSSRGSLYRPSRTSKEEKVDAPDAYGVDNASFKPEHSEGQLDIPSEATPHGAKSTFATRVPQFSDTQTRAGNFISL